MDLNVSRDGEAGGMGEGEQLTLSLKLPAVVTTFQFEYTAQGFLAFYTVPLFFFFCGDGGGFLGFVYLFFKRNTLHS